MFFARSPYAARSSPQRIAAQRFGTSRVGRFAGFGAIIPGMPLTLGASNADVKAVQERLLFLGYQVSVDGVFGVALQTAVQQFQSENGLGPTGNIDHYFWNKLDAAAREKGFKPTALAADHTTQQTVVDINVDGQVRTLVKDGQATGEKPWTAEEGGFTAFNYGGGRDPRVAAAEAKAAAIDSVVQQQQAAESSGSKWPLIVAGGALVIGAVVLLSKKRK